MQWDYLAIVAVSSLTSASVLIIATLGLAVIFGLMGVINLAHGEFIMIGAYAALMATRAGVPLPLAFLFAAVVAAAIGAVIEWLIIRHLYGRLLDTLLATWGLSLALYQTAVLIFGSTTPGVGLPLANVAIGHYSISVYFLFLPAAAILMLMATYVILTRTSYGIMARASIQDRETASAIGIETRRINTITFAFGAGLAGLAGGLLVSVFAVNSGLGTSVSIKAFIMVMLGGAGVVSGAIVGAFVLGFCEALGYAYIPGSTTYLLILAGLIIFLVVRPQGIMGKPWG